MLLTCLMVFLMDIMVYECITGIVKTTVQFNGQSALPDTPPPYQSVKSRIYCMTISITDFSRATNRGGYSVQSERCQSSQYHTQARGLHIATILSKFKGIYTASNTDRVTGTYVSSTTHSTQVCTQTVLWLQLDLYIANNIHSITTSI
jgi:cytosine/uracil/thiamine/allantoin permease